jgi:hypothetical protein
LPWLKGAFGDKVAEALANIVDYRGREAAPPSVPNDGRPVIQIVPGELSRIADEAEQALISAGVPFYERANTLVRVIVKEVDTFHGGTTTTAQFVQVDHVFMRDMLCRKAGWCRMGKKAWVPTDVPHDVAGTVLGRSGEWQFPSVAGIVMMPTMRPDGTILGQPGYDLKTRLLLIDAVKMPPIQEKPTREAAIAALKLITDLLWEFAFVDDVAKAVAVSAIVTTVLRGAFPVVPIHVTDSPVAGSGKSYYFDILSTIVSGQRMPVISAGGSREETEKRIGAAIIAGQPLICIDNLNCDNGELGGPALSRIARAAFAGSGSPSISGSAVGKTCQDRPNLSLSHPHGPSSPPAASRSE